MGIGMFIKRFRRRRRRKLAHMVLAQCMDQMESGSYETLYSALQKTLLKEESQEKLNRIPKAEWLRELIEFELYAILGHPHLDSYLENESIAEFVGQIISHRTSQNPDLQSILDNIKKEESSESFGTQMSTLSKKWFSGDPDSLEGRYVLYTTCAFILDKWYPLQIAISRLFLDEEGCNDLQAEYKEKGADLIREKEDFSNAFIDGLNMVKEGRQLLKTL